MFKSKNILTPIFSEETNPTLKMVWIRKYRNWD